MGYYDGTFNNYEITSKDPDIFLVFIAGLLMLVCTILGFKIRFHDDDKKLGLPKSVHEGSQEDGSDSSASTSNNSTTGSSTNISTANISVTNISTNNNSSNNNITNGSVKKQDGTDDDISEDSSTYTPTPSTTNYQPPIDHSIQKPLKQIELEAAERTPLPRNESFSSTTSSNSHVFEGKSNSNRQLLLGSKQQSSTSFNTIGLLERENSKQIEEQVAARAPLPTDNEFKSFRRSFSSSSIIRNSNRRFLFSNTKRSKSLTVNLLKEENDKEKPFPKKEDLINNRVDSMLSSGISTRTNIRRGKFQMMKHFSTKSGISMRQLKQSKQKNERTDRADSDGYESFNDNPQFEKQKSLYSLEGSIDSTADATLKSEVKKLFGLAAPWSFSSLIGSISSVITISMISHYLGVEAMLCYSYVWFIIGAAQMVSSALYGSLYKHVNNAAALETEEGYTQAGRFIRISIIYSSLLQIPISILLVKFMEFFLRSLGYDDDVTSMATAYTVTAVIDDFLSTVSGFITIISDVEGHADFDAMWDLFDYGIDILLMFLIIPTMKPTLFQLGLIHILQSIISLVVYYLVTWYYWGWFDKYKAGIFSELTSEPLRGKEFGSLWRKTIPLLLDAVTGELEWFVLTYFAAWLGPAESATWILSSYIWGIITVLPDCISSASEMRVSHLLSRGNITIAKQLSHATMVLSGVFAAFCGLILFIFRVSMTKTMTNDDVLEWMLLEIIPYLVVCQPLISVTTAASDLNRALGMYQRSTKMELFLTCTITIPAAYISTIEYGYNIEGLIFSSIVGYGILGTMTLALFNNADWDKAVAKNKKMSGIEDSSSSLESGLSRVDEVQFIA